MPETVNKTVMTEWAESSLEFSAAMKKLLDEFGFGRTSDVQWIIRRVFPPKYLDVCGHAAKIREDDFFRAVGVRHGMAHCGIPCYPLDAAPRTAEGDKGQ